MTDMDPSFLIEKKVQTDYFEWLEHIVTDGKEYNLLLHDLHNIDFVSLVKLDENREMDGQSLRTLYGDEVGIKYEEIEDYLAGPCSVLEMLIGLASRIEGTIFSDFEEGIPETRAYFWEFLTNLGLEVYTDVRYSTTEVRHIVERFVFREYDPDGKGGIFPLQNAGEDQRKVQIWYQMQMYYIEKM